MELPRTAFLVSDSPVDEILSEMSGYIPYIEDLNRSDKSKVAPYLERMRSLSERLSQLAK